MTMGRPESISKRRKRFRAQADFLLRESARKIAKLPAGDMHKLAPEIHVHQMEIEMQNEELRRVQLELEVSRDHFSALYDFSPVGYLKLSQEGIIREANLTFAAQMGIDRRDLIGRKFSHFLAPESREIFHSHLQESYKGTRQVCVLQILKLHQGSFTGLR